MADLRCPDRVKIVEVGPRDGLQTEPGRVPTEAKIELIDRLGDSGLTAIEATSFVSPKWIPQLADAEDVYRGIERRPGVSYPALVPNTKGLERALAVDVAEIAVFTAASEAFNQKNINCSIAESIERFRPIVERARELAIPVRGYISCALGCPYQGEVPLSTVADVAVQLQALGCYELSLGDTIGVGTPMRARRLIETTAEHVPLEHLAVHFHDTRAQALPNILACLDLGVAVVDAAVAGLGGCPYAKGASGNVATEDVVYMLHGMGIETGVDLDKLIATGHFISETLNRRNESKLGRAST